MFVFAFVFVVTFVLWSLPESFLLSPFSFFFVLLFCLLSPLSFLLRPCLLCHRVLSVAPPPPASAPTETSDDSSSSSSDALNFAVPAPPPPPAPATGASSPPVPTIKKEKPSKDKRKKRKHPDPDEAAVPDPDPDHDEASLSPPLKKMKSHGPSSSALLEGHSTSNP